jgi:hypothetical protein
VKIFPAARAENIPPAAGGVDAERGTAVRSSGAAPARVSAAPERFPPGATETERGNAPEAREWLPDTAEVDVERLSEVEPDTDLEALDPETALTRRCASLSSFDAELAPTGTRTPAAARTRATDACPRVVCIRWAYVHRRVGLLFAVVGLDEKQPCISALSQRNTPKEDANR